MNQNLFDFVTKLAIKRVGKKNFDSEDVASETFINLILEGIDRIEGNELRINHLIVYHWNKLKRASNKFQFIDNAETFDKYNEIETSRCNTDMIGEYFNRFKSDSSINPEHLELFYKVKFLRIPYAEASIDNGSERKKVNRVLVKFKAFLEKEGVTLEGFYDEDD